jgi:hypothetical protein
MANEQKNNREKISQKSIKIQETFPRLAISKTRIAK